jgi:transposase
MLFLARWARKLSWKETAEAFHTSWDRVCDAVELCGRPGIGASHLGVDPGHWCGVDEIQYAKGHKYLTLVYQIDGYWRDGSVWSARNSMESETVNRTKGFATAPLRPP